jgi:hypothetical protein
MKRAVTLALAGTVALVGVVAGSYGSAGAQRLPTPVVEVYKTPTCGCCALWVDHLKANGFEVRTTDLPDVVPLKVKHGVPDNMYSCHTGVVDGYAIEGHVPAAEIHRLLQERPPVGGLAVPGMPIGSPGMEVGNQVQPYDVLAFEKQGGGSRVFASYPRR